MLKLDLPPSLTVTFHFRKDSHQPPLNLVLLRTHKTSVPFWVGFCGGLGAASSPCAETEENL